MTPFDNIVAVILFYILPYLVTIALPGVLIPWIVKKKFVKVKHITFMDLLPFFLPLLTLLIVANILWEQLLFQNVLRMG